MSSVEQLRDCETRCFIALRQPLPFDNTYSSSIFYTKLEHLMDLQTAFLKYCQLFWKYEQIETFIYFVQMC